MNRITNATGNVLQVGDYIEFLYNDLLTEYNSNVDSYGEVEKGFMEIVIQGLGSTTNYLTVLSKCKNKTAREASKKMIKFIKNQIRKIDEREKFGLN